MSNLTEPKLPKWSFFLGDVVLFGGAWFIFSRSNLPIGAWHGTLIVGSIALGACLSILPFVLEYRLAARLAEAEVLSSAVEQIGKIEGVAEQITAATARWQSAQEVADRVAATSKAIAERMSAETKSFTEFMQRANDGEKATLRLEVDKLRRAEGDWMQVLVRVLDHVYALHVAGVRSGQPKLVAQLDQFQQACRDAARWIGLTPFTPSPNEPFDAQRHQLLDASAKASPGSVVGETIATGYTFQGRLLRPAIVTLKVSDAQGLGLIEPQNTNQPQLPLVEPSQV